MYRKYYLYILFLLLPFFAIAQVPHVVAIRHPYYTSYFSTEWHIPVLVTYTLTSKMVECESEQKTLRPDNFKADSLFPEETALQRSYTNSGYDRGHNMSAADNSCDWQGMNECFYFSNMTPQPHAFNNGRWKELEMMERDWAKQHGKLKIFVGSLDPLHKRIGPDKVCVPRYMYKVIYRPSDHTYTCYVFPNSVTTTKPMETYKVNMRAFSKSSGITFTNGSAHAVFITKAKTIGKQHPESEETD